MSRSSWLLSHTMADLIDRHTREALFVLGDEVIPAEYGGVYPPGKSGERFRQLRDVLAKAYADALRHVATDTVPGAAPDRVPPIRNAGTPHLH